jgi:hypothetical protein
MLDAWYHYYVLELDREVVVAEEEEVVVDHYD